MKKRYEFMNLLRVLSMVAIVFYHMTITLYIYGIRQVDSIRMLYENSNMHIAKVGVSLFFILSGCGLMLSSKDKDLDILSFFKKRFVKILVPFYIVYIGYFIFLKLTKQISLSDPFAGKPLKPYSFVFTLLGMDAYLENFNVPTCSLGIGEWFLGCLILMYILYPLLMCCMKKKPVMTMIAATVYYVVILILMDSYNLFAYVPMYMNFIVKVYDFILGMFLAMIIDNFPKWIWIPGLLVNLFFVLCPVTLPGIDSWQIILHSLSAFIAFSGLESLLEKAPKVSQLIAMLCAVSYEYFLIHHVVILNMSRIGQNTAFGNLHILMLFAGEAVVTLILALALRFIVSLPGKLRATN